MDTVNREIIPRTATNGVNVVLGVWLIISPFVLGFAGTNGAAFQWNNIAVGIAVILVALTGPAWLNVLLGAWEIISPWVLGFSGASTPLWNNIVIGALVLLFAIGAVSASTRAPVAGPPPSV